MNDVTLESLGSAFGHSVKSKLASPAAAGEPEDQLRAPLERLNEGLAVLGGLPAGPVMGSRRAAAPCAGAAARGAVRGVWCDGRQVPQKRGGAARRFQSMRTAIRLA